MEGMGRKWDNEVVDENEDVDDVDGREDGEDSDKEDGTSGMAEMSFMAPAKSSPQVLAS